MLAGSDRYFGAVVDHLDVTAITQAVGAFEHYPLALGQALVDHGVVAIAGAEGKFADTHLVVAFHDIHERAVGAELDRR
ncbi:hypothetical protein D3C84_1153460 [compost metagenome]